MTNAFLQTALLRAKSRNKNKKQNGFTLIELMVVVAIVGVLTAVGLPQLTKAQDKAKDAAASATLTNAAKECSLDLITGADSATVFDAPGYLDSADVTRIGGDCELDTDGNGADLTITSESAAETTFTVTFTGAVPNPPV